MVLLFFAKPLMRLGAISTGFAATLLIYLQKTVLHRQKFLDDLDGERRSFLKRLAGGGAAAAWAGASTLATPASAQIPLPAGKLRHRALGLFQQASKAAA
jgi:hypothetical protein